MIETSDAEPRFQLRLRHAVGGGQVDHLVSFHCLGTSSELDVPEPLKARVASHLLLSQLPDEGMKEALESLVQMWQFYRKPVVRTQALPTPVTQAVRLGPSYTRPEFQMTEE